MVKLVFFDLDAHEQDIVRDAFARESDYGIDLHDGPLTNENASLAHDADAIGIFVTSHVTREILDLLPNLKVIAAMSTGFDNIDADACRERNIAVCNVPFYGESTVAEFAFGLIFALARKFRPMFERTARGDFSRTGLVGMDLDGKTLGLIGTGHIGSHLARLAHAAGMKIVAYDPHPKPDLARDYAVATSTSTTSSARQTSSACMSPTRRPRITSSTRSGYGWSRTQRSSSTHPGAGSWIRGRSQQLSAKAGSVGSLSIPLRERRSGSRRSTRGRRSHRRPNFRKHSKVLPSCTPIGRSSRRTTPSTPVKRSIGSLRPV